MGSSFSSLGNSSWANAELEDMFEVASPKNNASSEGKEVNSTTTTTTTTTDEKKVVAPLSHMRTPPLRQRSTLSLSEFEREGLSRSNHKSGRLSPKPGSSSNRNPLVSPRERKGLKKSKSERFTGLDTKKINKPASLRDLKKDVGKTPTSRRAPERLGSDMDLKSLKARKVKDCFESSDWLSSCYVDPIDKEVDKEPRRRTRTIVVDQDSNDVESLCDDVRRKPNQDSIASPKATTTSGRARPSLHRTASMPCVQKPNEDPPAYSKNSNHVWNDKTSPDSTSTITRVPTTLKRSSSTSTTEGGDRRSRFGLTKAFQSFRQLPTGATTPSSDKKTSLKTVLRGAVQIVEKQPGTRRARSP